LDDVWGQVAELLGDLPWRLGPDAVGVWVVGAPSQLADTVKARRIRPDGTSERVTLIYFRPLSSSNKAG
jgi:hypothetical protein